MIQQIYFLLVYLLALSVLEKLKQIIAFFLFHITGKKGNLDDLYEFWFLLYPFLPFMCEGLEINLCLKI